MKVSYRVGLYLLGLFVIALGLNITIRANLGVTPVTALSLAVSQISGVSLGTVTVVVYASYVLGEILLLGRKFKLKNLLQVPFNFAFGFFVDLTGTVLRDLTVQGYGLQLLLLLLGVAAIALGVVLMISMDIVPNAPDGIVLAYCERTGMSFSKAKLGFDALCVVLSIVLSLLFLRRITAVREGTVLAALLTGRLIGVFSKPLAPWLRRVAFADAPQLVPAG